MTPVQKEEIYKLRLQGLGYKVIAKELLISVDMVKSQCKRHQLTGQAKLVQINTQVFQTNNGLCLQCNKSIQKRNRGRTKKFCSEICRYTWWNKNQDKRNRNSTAMYQYICFHCGRSFTSYGNKQRKYCSHHCYIKNRFWRDEYGI